MNERYTIAQCIARWGNPASIALMDPGCQIFSTPNVPGVIGYRFESNNVIVFGDPLCDPDHLNDLTNAFHAQFKDVKNIIYMAATERFMQGSLNHHCEAAIGIGQEIILDPTKDPRKETGYRASLLRRNCKGALRNNVQIDEYKDNDNAVEQKIEAVGEAWLNNRQGPQVYLQNVNIFSHREHRRYFYAKHQDKIIGVLILNRLDAYQGWVISFSMVCQGAPNGTSELLIVTALEKLGQENCHYFAIGTVPIASIDDIHGLNPMTSWCIRKSYGMALKMFHLEDRERYWRKFAPISESTYLVLSKPKLGLSGVMGIMSALNASNK